MAIESNFSSLFQNLKLDDHPWLPSKPWESISSESGVSHSKTSSEKSPHEPLYESSTLSEANLVRLVINALQGVESTLISIEKLSESFCLSPADRTSHRIPNLWYRSSSSSALGKILKSVGHAGLIALLLRKFVDYFLCINLNVDVISREEGAETKGVDEMETHHGYSLVNQAFSVAVGKILEGYVCALDTLYASVQMRRSEKKVDASERGVGCLTSVVHSEITLLEVYLHTKELRTRIETLGNICLLRHATYGSSTNLNDSIVEAATEFSNFPRGGNLLTYLYAQLRDADPVHHALLKFLFVRSCEPYCGFIESWIYQARINDPYKEFIVEYLDEYASFPDATAGFSLTSIKERDGVAVPCFLKDICLPLVRAGQQLQVLVKLLDLCRYLCPGDQNYKDILPFWTGASSDHSCNLSPLTFSKRDMDEMVLMRENMYTAMHEKLQILFTNLDAGYQQKSCNVVFEDQHLPITISEKFILICDPSPPTDLLFLSTSQPITTHLALKVSESHWDFLGVVAVKGKQATFGTIIVEENRSDAKFPGSFTFDDNMIFLSSKAEKGDLNLEAAFLDSEASSATDESSYEEDPWESSECSSLNSVGDLNDLVGPAEPHESSIDVELKYLSASVLHSNNGKVFLKPSQGERLNAPRRDSHKSISGMDSISHFVYTLGEETKLGNISEHFQSGDAKRSCLSETQYVDYQSVVCWPLGGLPKNPFNVEGGYKDETQSELTNCSLKVSEGDVPIFGEVLACDNSLSCQSKMDVPLENGIYASSDSFLSQSWDSKYKSKFFSMNPMLTKHAWLPTMDKSRSSSCIGYTQSSLPCFHFSSVQDPLMVFGERMLENLDRGFQSGLPSCVDFAVRMDGCVGEQGHDEGDILVDQRHSSSTFPLTFSENQQEGHVLTNASGGAEWENSLNYSGISVIHNAGAPSHSSGDAFNLPLDVIIDKCILHEISLQYKYVSNFTITLLEKGFDLREHLLALRRYHFMEVADWADLFIMSLWRHKRYAAGANQRISKVQGFLDMAVKRSSCAGDVYKEQLFVYMKEHGMTHLPTSTYGIHAFDFIALGYRVDWPVSIVITPDSLKIYAEIFSFLIQVKLAVFALTDVWCLLKDLVPLVGQNQDSGLGKQDKSKFDILMKMRHQVNHFVSTLQQYVQSQLSHVSWGRFLHALKHQVKDMLDLESIHMAYLADSLHICFLSDETKSVADIIENILQCALDFRSCFTCGGWEIGSDLDDSFKLLTRLKLSQVLTIKETFERNLKELYLCYLKSPKHMEYGLCRFWGFLNYNDYYSNVIGNARSFHVL